jgi:hypothetical protein
MIFIIDAQLPRRLAYWLRQAGYEWLRNNFPFYLSTGSTGGYSHSTPIGVAD